MKLFEIGKELEIEDDLNNLSREGLTEKYGSDVRKSLIILKRLGVLLRQSPYYSIADEELFNKLEGVVEDIKNNYSDNAYMTSRADSLLRKMARDRELEVEEGYLEYELLELNRTIGIGAFNCPIEGYDEIVNRLSGAISKLDSLGSQNKDMPEAKQVKRVFDKTIKNSKKYVSLRLFDPIQDVYDRYPLMNLCFDKDFLVLTNYLLFKTNLEEDDKKELIDLAKQVIEVSNAIEPISTINGDVDMDEYNRIAYFTSTGIKAYEHSHKAKVKKNIFK